jgi:hypothetical protein
MQPLTASLVSSLQLPRQRSISGRRSKMRVQIKGIHTTYKKLASGETRKYYYAWRGGPRIDAGPGTPEFVRLYGEAGKKKSSEDNVRSLIDYFKDNEEYTGLSRHARRAYDGYLKLIDARFGTMPIAALEDKKARGEFKTFRSEFAATPRNADYIWTTLARVLAVANALGGVSKRLIETIWMPSASQPRADRSIPEDFLRKPAPDALPSLTPLRRAPSRRAFAFQQDGNPSRRGVTPLRKGREC